MSKRAFGFSQKERLARICQILDIYEPYILSKSRSQSAFRTLIGTILSAQSTGKQTRTAANALFDKADTPRRMIALGRSEIENLIKTVGLWRNKAKAIFNSSVYIIERFEGDVPADIDKLQELPGVGLKTASIVMSFYFGQPAMAVDTHIFRSARRWGLSSAKSADGVSRDLQKLFPKQNWNKMHVQMIRFARQYCRARPHNISECPMCSWAYSE